MKLTNSLFFIFYVVFNTILILILDLGKISTNIIIPLVFLFFVLINLFKINYLINHKEVRLYLLFIIYCFFSLLYTDFLDHAFSTNKRILIVSIFSFTLFSFSLSSFSNIYKIYLGYALALIIMIYFAVTNGLQYNGDERFELDKINANTYGYYIFTGLHACFILFNVQKKYKTVLFFILTALLLLSFIIILATASRGALVIAVLLVISNIYIYFQDFLKKLSNKFIIFVISFFSIFLLVNTVYNLYFKDSLVLERFDNLNNIESPRQFHYRKAIEFGLDNPFLGLGSGGYSQMPKAIEQGSFSHNTYTEIFANHGFVGLTIYFLFFYYIFKRLMRVLKITKDKTIIKQISIFLVLFLCYNFFYVTYLTAEFTGILFVTLSHIIIIERNHNKIKIIKIK